MENVQSTTSTYLDVELKTDFGEKACPEFASAAHQKLGQGEAYRSLRDKIWENGVKILNDTVLQVLVNLCFTCSCFHTVCSAPVFNLHSVPLFTPRQQPLV
jgi:hypothetical protein